MPTSAPNRSELLRRINEAFVRCGLPPWTETNLGSVREGQCEILDLSETRLLANKRLELVFSVQIPGGDQERITVRFGGTILYVLPMLLVAHGEPDRHGLHVALNKRWRIERGGWSYELPRRMHYFSDRTKAADPLNSPAHEVLAKTFGDVCLDALGPAKVVSLGQLLVKGEGLPAEAYLLSATVKKPFPRKKGDGAMVLLKLAEVLALIDQGEAIVDLPSVAVILRAARRSDLSQR